MQYLDPKDGWSSLRHFRTGYKPENPLQHNLDPEDDEELSAADQVVIEELSIAALATLQSCLNGQAVHGDLSPDNIFVR